MSAMAVALPSAAVAMPPAAKAETLLESLSWMNCFSRSPQPRMIPVRTMRTPHSSMATPPRSSRMTVVPAVMAKPDLSLLPLAGEGARRADEGVF
jgi:hypothetical protein